MSNYNRGGGGSRGGRSREPATLPEYPPFTAFIGHLPQGIIQSDVEHIFDDCGIAQVRMVYDKIDNKFKGYCYVEFNEQEGLVKALEFNGANIEGKTMKVDIAEQKRDNRGGAGGSRGGPGGRGGRGGGGSEGSDLRGGDHRGSNRGGSRGGRDGGFGGDRGGHGGERGGDNYQRGAPRGGDRGQDNFSRFDGGGRGGGRGGDRNNDRDAGNQDYQNFQNRGDRPGRGDDSYNRQHSNNFTDSAPPQQERRRPTSQSSQGSQNNATTAPAEQPTQRRRLNLKARSKPVDSAVADAPPARNSSIFGSGHARDATTRDAAEKVVKPTQYVPDKAPEAEMTNKFDQLSTNE